MRGSMVRELYYGNLSPWERKRVYPPERIALTDKIGFVERYDRLRAGPNEVQAGSLQNNIRCGRISLPLFQKEVYWEAPICPTALPKLSQQVHTHMEKGVKELQREGIDVLMINNNDCAGTSGGDGWLVPAVPGPAPAPGRLGRPRLGHLSGPCPPLRRWD